VRMRSARYFGVYESGEVNLDGALPGALVCASGAPQVSQNLLLTSTFAPQAEQTASNVAPHSRQNRAPSRFSAWHRGHFMASPFAGRRPSVADGRRAVKIVTAASERAM
jgi:hypothetical protein